MPTKEQTTRIQEIDALRGIALFGILLVNVFVFHAPYSYYGEFYGAFTGSESIVIKIVTGFAAGKFLFIFAFLFGYGIQLQLNSYKNRFRVYFSKRMLVLLFFGILHILLFWFGDILASYALLGFLILPTIRFSNRIIIVLGVFFLFFSPLYYVGVAGLDWPLVAMRKSAELNEFISTFQRGNYLEIFNLRIKETLSFLPENLVWYIPKSLGLFFLGIYASRQNIIQRIRSNAVLYTIVSLSLIFLAVLWQIYKLDFFSKFDMVAVPMYRPLLIFINVTFESLLGFGYIIGFLLLFQKSNVLTSILAKPGKMALSNYITQSFLCVIIFYGFGFGYYGKLNPSNLVLISVVIFLINVVVSHIYLKKREIGPLESFWRKLSQKKSIQLLIKE